MARVVRILVITLIPLLVITGWGKGARTASADHRLTGRELTAVSMGQPVRAGSQVGSGGEAGQGGAQRVGGDDPGVSARRLEQLDRHAGSPSGLGDPTALRPVLPVVATAGQDAKSARTAGH